MVEHGSAAPRSHANTGGHRLADYRPVSGWYDEMCTDTGELRPHWEYVMRSLDALEGDEFDRRTRDVHRLLFENGVTYNVYDDSRNETRAWPLDPIPLLFTSSEWSVIEQGLIQRAEILDLLLADIYGPRRLLKAGVLPEPLLFTHPGFLRPCDAVPSPGPHRLVLYAADLARTPQGTMTVIGDRTQAPSGAGYALENRTVLSRVFPSLYRDAHVHRLALFFRGLRSSLNSLAPLASDNPRVVLLTPGSDSETYFEHAYLATYLAYTLAQGNDLVVRDDRVWLKTLDSMKPVDVILRRVDDVYCDPLELRGESLLGTAGLLQCCRLGQVAIANPLGSGILEHPGLLAVLPALARELLDEDLKLPSVATWWCGDPEARAFVLDHLDRLVIKPIIPHASTSTVFGSKLTGTERWMLAERIRAQPHLFVGQEEIALSTAPVTVDGRLEPRPVVLRSFLAASPEGGYLVMPGGLGRVSPSRDTSIVSNQRGGVSKDVWVLASEPERQVSLLPSISQPLAAIREDDDVPARVADNLFWLGRYAERTEGAARLLREVVLRVLSSDGPPDESLTVLLRAVTIATVTYPGFVGDGAAARLLAPETEVLRVLLDERRVGSVRYNLEAVVRTGRSVRDHLSSDTLRVINALHRELNRPLPINNALEVLERVIIHLAAFAGLCRESMSHGQGWRFLETGRALERGLHTITLLQAVAPVTASHGGVCEALLAIVHCLKTYRRRYRSQMQPRAVLELVLLDETNPRSVGYQLVHLHGLIEALGQQPAGRRGAAERVTLEAVNRLRAFDLDTVGSPSDEVESASDPLANLLTGLAELLARGSDELTRRYFTPADLPHQLVQLA